MKRSSKDNRMESKGHYVSITESAKLYVDEEFRKDLYEGRRQGNGLMTEENK